jgi:site-specific DNA recombinase
LLIFITKHAIKKLENAEERFVTGELDQVLYFKYRDKFRENIRQIETELDSSKIQLSNLQKSAEMCLDLALKLPSTWKNANFSRKQRIQNLVFPEGIFYDRKKDDYRTSRINLLFSAIPYLTGLVEAYKNGDLDILAKIPTWVVPLGLEPRTT